MWSVVLFVVSLVVSWLTSPKSEQSSVSPGEVEVGAAEQGGFIGIVFGTRDIDMTPTVVWYGDTRVVPIKKSSGGKK